MVIPSERGIDKPNLSMVGKQNLCVLSANSSEVGIAFNQAPAPFPVEEQRRATSQAVGTSLINCSASCLAVAVYS